MRELFVLSPNLCKNVNLTSISHMLFAYLSHQSVLPQPLNGLDQGATTLAHKALQAGLGLVEIEFLR